MPPDRTTDPVLPNLTIQQLEYLDAVLGAPTWAAAAQRLGVTPSALSQGIAELERRVGVPIFERDGRRRVLRAQAEEVASYAREVLARTRELARWSAATTAGRVGSLRLGMIDAAAIGHYPEVLRRFRVDHPDVALRLTVAPSGALLDELAAAELDLVVCIAPPHGRAGIDTVKLLDEPLAVYAPAGTTAGRPAAWGPWVTFPEGSHTRRAIAAAVEQAGARFDVVAESHQPDVLAEMVRLGLGWTVLPVAQAEQGPDPLVRARAQPLLHRRLVAARRAGAAADPLVADLVAAMRSLGR
jgi:DNA-binding transcriptional LysR family regulator